MGVLSRYMQSSYQLYWTATCRILHKGTPGKELFYRPSYHLDIVRYFDVDWAGDPIAHCFSTDYCTFGGNNLVTWRCKKQKYYCSI